MADGDIVHSQLPPGYQSLYKGVCEGIIDEEGLARQALRRLIKEKDLYGDAPFQLIQQEAFLFEQLAALLKEEHAIDWSEAWHDIHELVRIFSGSQRGLQLALRACEYQLDLLEKYGQERASSDFVVEITKKYLLNIYDERFEQRVPQVREHYQGVPSQFVEERLMNMRPFVVSGIESFAHQIVEGKSLRLRPRHTKLQEIDLDSDINRDLLDLL